jgi:pentatricopeptide repeat protein
MLQGTMLRSCIRYKRYKEALKIMKNMHRRGVHIKERDVYELRDSIEKNKLAYSSGKKVDRRVLNELMANLPEDPNRVRKMMKSHLKQHKKVNKIVTQIKF